MSNRVTFFYSFLLPKRVGKKSKNVFPFSLTSLTDISLGSLRGKYDASYFCIIWVTKDIITDIIKVILKKTCSILTFLLIFFEKLCKTKKSHSWDNKGLFYSMPYGIALKQWLGGTDKIKHPDFLSPYHIILVIIPCKHLRRHIVNLKK